MGFFNALGKIIYGAADLGAEMMAQSAKSIDHMSDEELKKKHLKAAKMIRRDSAMMSDEELERKYCVEAGELRKDVRKMSDEELERKYSVSADEMRMKAEMWKMQSEMWKMKKEEREMRAKILRMEKEQQRECDKSYEISGHDENDEYDEEFGE